MLSDILIFGQWLEKIIYIEQHPIPRCILIYSNVFYCTVLYCIVNSIWRSGHIVQIWRRKSFRLQKFSEIIWVNFKIDLCSPWPNINRIVIVFAVRALEGTHLFLHLICSCTGWSDILNIEEKERKEKQPSNWWAAARYHVFSCPDDSLAAQQVTLWLSQSLTETPFDFRNSTVRCDFWDIWSEWWGNIPRTNIWIIWDNFGQFLMIFTILDNYDNFWHGWQFLTIVDKYWQMWIHLIILDNFDHFEIEYWKNSPKRKMWRSWGRSGVGKCSG